MSQQQQQQKQPQYHQRGQPKPQPQYQQQQQRYTPFPLTSSNVRFSTARNVHPSTAPRRPSDISEVPTSELSAALGDQYLVDKKHNDIAARIPNSPETRRLMMQQCVADTPDRVPELKEYFASFNDADHEHAPLTSEDLEQEILADQQALDYATKRYREAAEAFHFWDTEIWKIHAKMRTRERLPEVKQEKR